MFTILPTLYIIGVDYFRKWRTTSYNQDENVTEISENNKNIQLIVDEPSTPPEICENHEQYTPLETCENHEYISEVDNNRNHKIKSRKKKHHRRRKTSLSELSYDDIMYLINETGFTQEEIILWYQEFLRDCPDGRLPKSKFITTYQQFYKNGHVEKFCDYAFRLFNKDGSGYMDFMEFLLAVSLTSSKDPKRKSELFFAMYDIDHNGLIDGNEMRSVIESIYELMGVDISDPSRIDTKVYELFSKAECDQLGYLRRDQFAMACKNDRHIRKFLKSNTTSSDNYPK